MLFFQCVLVFEAKAQLHVSSAAARNKRPTKKKTRFVVGGVQFKCGGGMNKVNDMLHFRALDFL